MYLVCSIYYIGIMLYEYVTERKNELLLVISCAILAVLASIRYQIGVDYDSYREMFQSLLQDPNSCPREFGWRYITYFLSFLGFNEYGCFAFWGILTMSLMYYGIRKHSPYPLISCGFFFLGYLGMLFSGMRQMVVCAILIASLDVIYKREHIKALIIFLVALSIHNAAFFLIPLYFLAIYDPVIGKHKYWILLIALILGVGGYVVYLLLQSTYYMPSPSIAYSVKIHLTAELYNETEWEWGAIAKRVVLVLIILFLSESVSKKWKYARVCIPLYFWGNIIAFSLLSSYTISARICQLTKMQDLLILPSFLLVAPSPTWRRIVILVIIVWGGYALYRGCFVLDANLYPFQTIFDSE